MTTKKPSTTKKPIARPAARASRAAIAVLLLAWVAAPARAYANPASAEGVIAGTVFSETGRSVPGARVLVALENNPKKKYDTGSDGRGEFAVRVPAGVGRYVVTVDAKGFASQSKTVEVFESEKVSVTFLLTAK